MKICLMVYAPQKGLLASIGKELNAQGHEVVFAARDKNVAAAIGEHFPNLGANELVVMSELNQEPQGDITSECLWREKEYGETFAMMIAHDRGLGKGYLFNVQGQPPILKAWWPREEKYRFFLKELICYEKVLDKLNPELVIAVAIPKSAHLVCRARNIKVRILTPPRFGSLYRWAVDEMEQSPALTSALEGRAKELADDQDLPATEFEQTSFAQFFFSTYKYDFRTAAKTVLRLLYRETGQLVKRSHKCFSGSYAYLGWCGPVIRKPFIYKYLLRHGVRPEDLDGNRVVLFPLHMEPEASLLNLSPEQNNSMELIAWISKSLPADVTLVVKEHPDSFGMRPKFFYENMRRMANVVFAHPEVHGKLWLDRCEVLANITSTMGFEAVGMDKPVLSFGAHQVINVLDTVEYADSFTSTRNALQRLLADDPDREHQLRVSRVALDMAFKDVCFDLSGYEATFKSNALHMDMARKALDGLRYELPELDLSGS